MNENVTKGVIALFLAAVAAYFRELIGPLIVLALDRHGPGVGHECAVLAGGNRRDR